MASFIDPVNVTPDLHPQSQSEPRTTLHTERLVLHLADPSNQYDCKDIIRMYQELDFGGDDRMRAGVNTIADVERKHKLHGPKGKFCLLAPPPNGMFFLGYLHDSTNDGMDGRSGALVCNVVLTCRPDMPWPDMGYGVLPPYQGKGYAAEAAQVVLSFWRNTIGVREICALTKDENVKSQIVAECIGFVKSGKLDIRFKDGSVAKARGMVLPGMQWKDGLTVGIAVFDPDEKA